MLTTDNGHIPVVAISPITSTCLSNIKFSSVLVKRAISKLKAKSQGGPDVLPPLFIKTCTDQLCTPLAYVYSQCVEFSYLPPDWLRAYTTPEFKKGDPSSP